MLQRIKGRLGYSGISQAVLAAELGVSQSSLSHWLSGQTRLPSGMDDQIYHALGRLETAEAAARAARQRSLAETEGAP